MRVNKSFILNKKLQPAANASGASKSMAVFLVCDFSVPLSVILPLFR